MSLGLILVASSCSTQQQSNHVERVVAVKATVIHSSDRQVTRTYTGSLEGEQQAVLHARLPEAVREIVAPAGKRVEADEVILTLDKYGPSSSYVQAYSVYENAKKNYDKMKFLFDQGAISESQYDGAKTDFEVAEAQFQSVNRSLEIHTPIAGVVTAVNVSPGDLVQVGQPLATVATVARLRVKFGVNSDDLAYINTGDNVVVRSEAVTVPASGRVVRVASSADPDTRSFQVEAIIENTDGRFNPGMFVHIDYILRDLRGVIAVPREAILTLDNEPTVFKAVGGKASLSRVKLGADLSGDVVVTSGLAAGDTLITLGQDYLDSGVSVNLTEINEMK